MAKPTCGPLFLKSLSKFTDGSREQVMAFSAGHMTGQAEKVYLGACPAFMVRPSPDYYDQTLANATHIAAIYGLHVYCFDKVGLSDEIWVCNPNYNALMDDLNDATFESVAWHTIRGLLCGVRYQDIDVDFHLREGYRQSCDKV